MTPRERVAAELARVAAKLGAPSDLPIEVSEPREPNHGDLASNLALLLARPLGSSPREVAQRIAGDLSLSSDLIERVEVAGPGFINFHLAGAVLAQTLRDIVAAGPAYGRSAAGRGTRVNVEFVSANPTGPLHVAHGRGAALGDCISSLLEWTGHQVTREFYVNDAGSQVAKLGESLWARVQQRAGRSAEVPVDGYHGAYVVDLAEQFVGCYGAAVTERPEQEGVASCRDFAVAALRAAQEKDLEAFRVRFDVCYEESRLYREGAVEVAEQVLREAGQIYEADGAVWLASSRFGDDKDRVLRRSDGEATYFLPDIAYHRDKARRSFRRAIDVWGADHHGYVPRMRAAMRALGLPADFFAAVIVQLVTVMRGGVEVRMSKRAGEFITLRELCEEVGVDAARYFFVMRRADTPFAFDVDLATRQSEENPVFYVQMAHARMAGIFRVGGVDPASVSTDGVDLTLLSDETEIALIKVLGRFPDVVARAALKLEPQQVTAYLEALAAAAHAWYHHCRVLGEEPGLARARLVLARATRTVLANGLRVLGLEAPDRM